jgi:hypothetical protein
MDRCYDLKKYVIVKKNLPILTPNKAKLCTNWIKTWVFEENAHFVAENLRKSQKIVIITSTPDAFLKQWPKMYPNCRN